MTVMPFILIFQLVFSGALFTLSGPLSNVSSLTITRWGLNAACTSADYNELESMAATQMEEKLYGVAQKNNLPVSKELVHTLVEKNMEESYYPAYEYTTGHLLKQWGMLLIHCVVYAGISIVALEFVDKDKR